MSFLYPDSLQFSFYIDEVKMDIFMLYTEGNMFWNEGFSDILKYKYMLPRFDLRWTEFFDLPLRVPYPTLPYIEACYGKNWNMPKEDYSYAKDSNNMKINGIRFLPFTKALFIFMVSMATLLFLSRVIWRRCYKDQKTVVFQ